MVVTKSLNHVAWVIELASAFLHPGCFLYSIYIHHEGVIIVMPTWDKFLLSIIGVDFKLLELYLKVTCTYICTVYIFVKYTPTWKDVTG